MAARVNPTSDRPALSVVMGREAPPPEHGAGSSSGQKRKAAMEDGGGEDNVPPPSWLKLSLGPVVYGDATDVDDDGSCAPVTTSPEERPPSPVLQHAMGLLAGVVSGSTAQPSTVPVPDVDDAVVAPSFVASATGLLVDHHGNGGAFMAAGVLFTGDASGSIPNGAVHGKPVLHGCTSTSPPGPLHLQRHHQSSTVRQPPRPTRRRMSTASSSGSGGGDDAAPPANIGNGANGDGNDNNNGNGNVLPNPPYPWATNEVAKHHSLAELSRRGITTLEGEAQCRRCDTRKVIVYNIVAKFRQVANYFLQNHQDLHDRAPARWMNPIVPDCDDCGQKNCVRPVIAAEKERINWLFLLLGETLGLCTLDQLKYFCAHTKRHRTGAKNRVLFSTYEELCNQLVPRLITRHDQLRIS